MKIVRDEMKIVNVIGGLGNQMFQYSFALALKNITKGKVKLDIGNFTGYKLHNGFEIGKIFTNYLEIANGKEVKKISYQSNDVYSKVLKKIFKRKKFEFYEQKMEYKEFSSIIDKKYFKGYWQSEKYFYVIKDEIKNFFKFPEIKDNKNMKILKRINSSNSVSIHIRRGDYVSHPIHGGICSIAYYKKAIEHLKINVKEPVFYIFSNDIQWCKENLNLSEANYIDWNQGEMSFRDMQLMSECQHNIIANSSFSWWGAWLNNNTDKIVVAPSKWFNSENMNIKDLIPKEWVKINVK